MQRVTPMQRALDHATVYPLSLLLRIVTAQALVVFFVR
jgi:uncharacterized transporter YbjL